MATFKSRLAHAFAVTITSLFLMAAGLANAENIQVPLGQQGDKNITIERPSAGMTKAQVQQRFERCRKIAGIFSAASYCRHCQNLRLFSLAAQWHSLLVAMEVRKKWLGLQFALRVTQ